MWRNTPAGTGRARPTLQAPSYLTPEEAEDFVSYVLSDEASRPPSRDKHQKLPLSGERLRAFGAASYYRGSDRGERIYVCVESLMRALVGNWEACLIVQSRIGPRLGKSKRGHRRRSNRQREPVVDTTETIRSLYNRFKSRHPWKEQLPGRDCFLEKWWWSYALWRGSNACKELLEAFAQARSGFTTAKNLAKRSGPFDKSIFDALAKSPPKYMIKALSYLIGTRQVYSSNLIGTHCLVDTLHYLPGDSDIRVRIRGFVDEFYSAARREMNT